ncbi:hypothetical protein P3S67_025850 [Capsicum chacoense]
MVTRKSGFNQFSLIQVKKKLLGINEFFVQRMGGPNLYSQRKGRTTLINCHRTFPVTHEAAERWLHHMQRALDSTTDIDKDSKTRMNNFFRHTAFFLVLELSCRITKKEQDVRIAVTTKPAACN